MKNNISFYPHYASSDQHAKFKMLRVEFGWEGEGKFWALNNRIALSENCCLNISKKYNKAAIANDLNFTLQEFDNFISFLKEDCELVLECEKGIITTDIIQEAFKRVMQDRGKARERHRRASGEKTETSGEKIYKGKESKRKKKEICPQQAILDLYHEILPEGTHHVTWDGNRAAALKARWNEKHFSKEAGCNSSQIEYWKGLFKFIRQSDFLMGKKEPTRGYPRFQISLDRIVKKKMFIDIIEGSKYANG